MKFEDAFYLSIKENRCIKRKDFHFSIFYVEELGGFCTGYNNEMWSPSEGDYIANDWEIE